MESRKPEDLNFLNEEKDGEAVDPRVFKDFAKINRYLPIHFMCSLVFGFLQSQDKFTVKLVPYPIGDGEKKKDSYYFEIENLKNNKIYVVFGPSHDKWDGSLAEMPDWDFVPDLSTSVAQVSKDDSSRFKGKVLIFPLAELRSLQRMGLLYYLLNPISTPQPRLHWAAYMRTEKGDYLIDPKNTESGWGIAGFSYSIQHFKEINPNFMLKNMNFQSLFDTNNCGKWLSSILEHYITSDQFPSEKMAINDLCKKQGEYVEWVQSHYPHFMPLLSDENFEWHSNKVVDAFNIIHPQSSHQPSSSMQELEPHTDEKESFFKNNLIVQMLQNPEPLPEFVSKPNVNNHLVNPSKPSLKMIKEEVHETDDDLALKLEDQLMVAVINSNDMADKKNYYLQLYHDAIQSCSSDVIKKHAEIVKNKQDHLLKYERHSIANWFLFRGSDQYSLQTKSYIRFLGEKDKMLKNKGAFDKIQKLNIERLFHEKAYEEGVVLSQKMTV